MSDKELNELTGKDRLNSIRAYHADKKDYHQARANKMRKIINNKRDKMTDDEDLYNFNNTMDAAFHRWQEKRADTLIDVRNAKADSLVGVRGAESKLKRAKEKARAIKTASELDFEEQFEHDSDKELNEGKYKYRGKNPDHIREIWGTRERGVVGVKTYDGNKYHIHAKDTNGWMPKLSTSVHNYKHTKINEENETSFNENVYGLIDASIEKDPIAFKNALSNELNSRIIERLSAVKDSYASTMFDKSDLNDEE